MGTSQQVESPNGGFLDTWDGEKEVRRAQGWHTYDENTNRDVSAM